MLILFSSFPESLFILSFPLYAAKIPWSIVLVSCHFFFNMSTSSAAGEILITRLVLIEIYDQLPQVGFQQHLTNYVSLVNTLIPTTFKLLPSSDPAAAAAAAKSLQSCPTLCDPRDGSPPGSPVPGILQARTLEWAAISFSSA